MYGLIIIKGFEKRIVDLLVYYGFMVGFYLIFKE